MTKVLKINCISGLNLTAYVTVRQDGATATGGLIAFLFTHCFTIYKVVELDERHRP